ncbi:uncharacterized protein GGS22DRAFT_190314 [Annulohypoxylon maeteangense]|uniref:uncharacterized protein n=1 Tax=Annulohypoxylon maeteangense TaxID=1927788 RepID=UPI002007AC3C|nr:uncharacterized protein GGS22DRAFT_190314 [Annulohypoxylon maeteangense]KAI0883012.1 hypothetical protein GGS22DRAFT_190314 [Annulohypoxylon maeteangense]
MPQSAHYAPRCPSTTSRSRRTPSHHQASWTVYRTYQALLELPNASKSKCTSPEHQNVSQTMRRSHISTWEVSGQCPGTNLAPPNPPLNPPLLDSHQSPEPQPSTKGLHSRSCISTYELAVVVHVASVNSPFSCESMHIPSRSGEVAVIEISEGEVRNPKTHDEHQQHDRGSRCSGSRFAHAQGAAPLQSTNRITIRALGMPGIPELRCACAWLDCESVSRIECSQAVTRESPGDSSTANQPGNRANTGNDQWANPPVNDFAAKTALLYSVQENRIATRNPDRTSVSPVRP